MAYSRTRQEAIQLVDKTTKEWFDIRIQPDQKVSTGWHSWMINIANIFASQGKTFDNICKVCSYRLICNAYILRPYAKLRTLTENGLSCRQTSSLQSNENPLDSIGALKARLEQSSGRFAEDEVRKMVINDVYVRVILYVFVSNGFMLTVKGSCRTSFVYGNCIYIVRVYTLILFE